MIGNATTETPWLTPEESCSRLKVSQKTFRVQKRTAPQYAGPYRGAEYTVGSMSS